MAAPRQSTGFINFGDFLNANRASAGALADRLSADSDNRRRLAGSELDNGTADFSRAVQAGTFDGRPIALGAHPAAYTGPTDIGSDPIFAKGEADAKEASEGAQRLSSLYGRMGMLGEAYGAGNPTYGAGQQAFDSALLGGVAQGRFEQGAKDSKGLLDRFASARTAAGQQVNQAQTTGAANVTAATNNSNATYGGRNHPNYTPGYDYTSGAAPRAVSSATGTGYGYNTLIGLPLSKKRAPQP